MENLHGHVHVFVLSYLKIVKLHVGSVMMVIKLQFIHLEYVTVLVCL